MRSVRFRSTAAAALMALAVGTGCGTVEEPTADDATATATGAEQVVEVPTDFPANIPLLEGTIAETDTADIGAGRRQWDVAVLVDGPEDPFYDALDKLREAGFETGDEVGVMTRHAQAVHVTSLVKDDQFLIEYLVTAPA